MFKIVFVVGNFTVTCTGMFYVSLACDVSILNIMGKLSISFGKS